MKLRKISKQKFYSVYKWILNKKIIVKVFTESNKEYKNTKRFMLVVKVK